jgi:hypothetical protein
VAADRMASVAFILHASPRQTGYVVSFSLDEQKIPRVLACCAPLLSLVRFLGEIIFVARAWVSALRSNPMRLIG